MRGAIAAILNRTKNGNGEAFHSTLARPAWEALLPEFVFEPGLEMWGVPWRAKDSNASGSFGRPNEKPTTCHRSP